MQRSGKHASLTIERLYFLRGPCRGVMKRTKKIVWVSEKPCGGGVQYLHRDPASRKRRWNRKSQIWECKIWSRVPRNSEPRKTALGRPSSIYKRRTRPLVREGAPQKQDHNCQIVIAKYLVMSPRWGSIPRITDWLTVSHNVTLTLTSESVEFRDASLPVYELGSRKVESRNWGIRIIECSSVELKVWRRREDFTCAIVPRNLECVIQWDGYSPYVKFRYQETTSGECKRLRTLVCV
jgi:hypothetical protein